MPGGGANRSDGRGMLTEQPHRSGRPRLCRIGNGSARPVRSFSPSHSGHWPWSIRSGMTKGNVQSRLLGSAGSQKAEIDLWTVSDLADVKLTLLSTVARELRRLPGPGSIPARASFSRRSHGGMVKHAAAPAAPCLAPFPARSAGQAFQRNQQDHRAEALSLSAHQDSH